MLTQREEGLLAGEALVPGALLVPAVTHPRRVRESSLP